MLTDGGHGPPSVCPMPGNKGGGVFGQSGRAGGLVEWPCVTKFGGGLCH